MKKKLIIYGAKSIALGICKSISLLYPDLQVLGFMVNSLENNPSVLFELPVRDIANWSKTYPNKEQILILICTPEDVHADIVNNLKKNEYPNYICIDSFDETKLIEQYLVRVSSFKSFYELPDKQNMIKEKEKREWNEEFSVFMAKSHMDREIYRTYLHPKWVHMIQVGATKIDRKIAEITDDTGDNISSKNGNYCELTALYWIWKNCLRDEQERQMNIFDKSEYYGLFQYRRILDIYEDDLQKLHNNKVDVILPFPTLHEPDIREHHARYIKEADWNAMLQALEELVPDYARGFMEILKQPYLYNYNIIIAKKEILKKYCAWLFPILKRTEELSIPKGFERDDRYIGYLGENLLTLYFLYHKESFNIVHTGRIMLT